MKKSQVLAALALAMALGVAAPVASTFAATDSNTQCNDARDEAKELLEDFDKDVNVTGALVSLVPAIEKFNDAFKPSASDLRKAWAQEQAGTFTFGNPSANKIDPVFYVVRYVLTYKGTKGQGGPEFTINDFTNKTYDEVVALGNTAHFPAGKNGSEDNFKALIKDYADPAMQSFVVPAITTGLNTLGLDENLTNENAGTVYAYINGLTPLKKLIALYDVIYETNGVCDGTDDEKVTEATENLKAAIAAYKNTTTKPGDAGETQKPSTPDTGVNTASEESATASVSILSGAASVITAAGVVIRKAFRK